MSSLEKVKRYEDLTFGQWKALATKCGGLENVLAILQEEKAVELKEVLLKLFDKNGHAIPHKDLKNAVCDPNKDFYLVQPRLETVDDYAGRLVRFQEAFKPGPFMSAAEFQGRAKELIAEIKNNKNLANLLNGVYCPTIIPSFQMLDIKPASFDLGQLLEKLLLGVREAYLKQFPDRRFYNYRENDLARKVSIIGESRHEELIEKMKLGPVPAIHFPNSFQGFSVLASREQTQTLPESFILSGIDYLINMAMYPDVLARGWYTPGHDLSAFVWQSPGDSRCFRARDDGLDFVSGGHLGYADGSYSSGLLFLESA